MSQQSAIKSAEFQRSVEALFGAFAHVPKPAGNVKFHCFDWQEIAKLLEQDRRQFDPQDVVSYFQSYDAAEELVEVFRYLLPGVLTSWANSFLRNDLRTSLFENMTPALGSTKLLINHLSKQEQEAAYRFMKNVFLDRLGQETSLEVRGSSASTYLWFYQFCAYGIISDDIARLWSALWEMSRLGHAIAVVQYASCLVCEDYDNPVFGMWTRESGGGVPELWEDGGLAVDVCWHTANIEFLRRTLNPIYLREHLIRSKSILNENPQRQIVDQLISAMEVDPDLVAVRCDKLPELLGSRKKTGGLSWLSVGAR